MSAIFSFGEVLIDMLPNGGQFVPLAGGAPANVAVAAAKLGAESYFLGGISRDAMGQFLCSELQKSGVNTSCVGFKPNKTALVLVTLDQDAERSFEFYRDNTADLAYTQADLDQVQWQSGGILHLCSNTLCTPSQHQLSMSAITAAKDRQLSVSLDVNLRLNLWCESEICQLSRRLDQVLNCADIVKLSLEELQWLARDKSLSEEQYLQFILDQNAELILLTDGANPIRAIGKTFEISVTPPAATPVDTTGAGDSFIGGFLYQVSSKTNVDNRSTCLASPELVTEFVEFASRCGAHTVTAKGAFAAMPNREDIK